LRDRHEEFVAKGIRVAVIGQGTHEDMRDFLETRPVPFETFADPERESYRAFGLARGTWRQVAYHPSVLRAGAAAALEGHIVGTPMGDPMQLPGSFAIKDGVVVYGHRAKTSADTAPVDELLSAV
jgi:alkyl-hydroperoxide reductase/thiol specific antioxidant family protein